MSGAITEWRRLYYLVRAWIVSALLAAGAIASTVHVFRSWPTQEHKSAGIIEVAAFVILATFQIPLLIRFRSQVIREYRYDGSALRFRTLRETEEQRWPLYRITSIRMSRGKARGIGYLIARNDGKQIVLDYFTSHRSELVTLLKTDLDRYRHSSSAI